MKNDTKPNGQKVSAQGHADYMLRKKETGKTDLVYAGNQLPSWADGSAQKFFRAAGRYEDKGNRRYKELEMSLPNELNLEQNLEIVNAFVEKHLKNHYYALAIHEKAGAISEENHPHVHIMFSERMIDEVERIKERPAYKYFKRAAKPLKSEKEASIERRMEHGAPKDKKWHDKKYLIEIRADFAEIQNEVLKKYGKTIRVDHRTLDEQQEEAEAKGDTFLSKVNLRVAEEYVGLKRAHTASPFVECVKKTRERNFKNFIAFFREEVARVAMKENEVKSEVKQAEMTARKYPEFSKDIVKLNELKRKIKTTLGNIEKAQTEYLTASEIKTVKKYKETLKQIEHLEKMAKEIEEPSTNQIRNLEAYDEIEEAVQKRIANLRKSLPLEEIEKIEEKIKSPKTYKNIALVSHQKFQEDMAILEELEKLSEDILNRCGEKEEKLEAKQKPEEQEIFSVRELKENLRIQYRELKMEEEKLESRLWEKSRKVVRASGAIRIAKNIYLKGEVQKLKEVDLKYEKLKKKYEKDLESYEKQKYYYYNKDWEEQSEKIQSYYLLMKSKIEVERQEEEMNKLKNELVRANQHIKEKCETEDAKEKIGVIAAAILHKNLPMAQALEKERKKLALLKEEVKAVRERLNFVTKLEYRPQNKYKYRVISSKVPPQALEDKNLVVSLIADALSGEKNAVQLVARSSGKNLEMEKDWELMSDLEKEEMRHQETFRSL